MVLRPSEMPLTHLQRAPSKAAHDASPWRAAWAPSPAGGRAGRGGGPAGGASSCACNGREGHKSALAGDERFSPANGCNAGGAAPARSALERGHRGAKAASSTCFPATHESVSGSLGRANSLSRAPRESCIGTPIPGPRGRCGPRQVPRHCNGAADHRQHLRPPGAGQTLLRGARTPIAFVSTLFQSDEHNSRRSIRFQSRCRNSAACPHGAVLATCQQLSASGTECVQASCVGMYM